MSEHNKNFYSLKEVERCLDATKEFQDGEELYYFIGALRYVYDENKQLKYQLQQKENIIKEVREYIKTKIEIRKNCENVYSYDIRNDDYIKQVDKLLEILDKKGVD